MFANTLHHVHAGVESSAPALELANGNAKLNGWQPSQYTFLKDDITKYMQQQIAEGALWDLVVLDPPKLAPNRKSLNRAMVKYRKLNTLVRIITVGKGKGGGGWPPPAAPPTSALKLNWGRVSDSQINLCDGLPCHAGHAGFKAWRDADDMLLLWCCQPR